MSTTSNPPKGSAVQNSLTPEALRRWVGAPEKRLARTDETMSYVSHVMVVKSESLDPRRHPGFLSHPRLVRFATPEDSL